MKFSFKFSAFEFLMLAIALVSVALCGLFLVSGTTFFAYPDFSQTIAPPVFEPHYESPNADPTPLPTLVPKTTATPMATETPSLDPEATPIRTAAPTMTPFPTLAPTEQQRIFLLYPTSQAVLTYSGVGEKKEYTIKLKFEVDPQNTPCRMQLKMGEEVILVKELDGSPTGIYEVSVSINKPALYKWQIFTQNSKSEERLFTIRK